ncbi:MAG: HlyD family efflux transporter periplasmic adaptor subunit [Calditrichaeota bacterium]|nr:HlyD family efflux transporter periplasmic adaptor subunit [Calditrichota bacterium]
MKNLTYIFLLFIFACNEGQDEITVYNGRIESETVRISAKTVGDIDSVLVDEGESVKKGQLLAVINTDKTKLRKKIQQAQLNEISANHASIQAQLKQLEAQLALGNLNLGKIENMLSKGAATQSQKDDIQTQVDVLMAKQTALKTQFNVIASKKEQLNATIDLTNLSIQDARIYAPINGVILSRFHTEGEGTAPGVPLFEMADLQKMTASIYVPLEELPDIQLSQSADIFISGKENSIKGSVSWIASESEFTPKTILTKETRNTLVYAVEISIENPDGLLKIGMPVDVSFAD